MQDREERSENEDGFCEALSQIPDRFIVTEEEIDWTVHEEYANYVQRLKAGQSHEDGPETCQTLFDPATPLETKRETLATLALCGTVDAYRAIEQYVKNPDPVLAHWSKVALYECRMALESELLEKPVGMISTGLGGVQHRLRYLVVVGFSGPVLDDGQRRRLESAWRTVCGQDDSILEGVSFHPSHVVLTLLVSLETAVGTVIDAGIAAANGDAPFLRQNYFVTNAAVPTEEEIQRILTEISTEEAPG